MRRESEKEWVAREGERERNKVEEEMWEMRGRETRLAGFKVEVTHYSNFLLQDVDLKHSPTANLRQQKHTYTVPCGSAYSNILDKLHNTPLRIRKSQ